MELIILAGLGGLTWLTSLGLDWLLKRRLQTFPEESVFVIPGFFRQPLLLVALVLIPLEIILPLAWALGPQDGMDVALGLGLPAIMLPLLGFALAMLRIHYGAVVLTQKGVRRVNLTGQKEIPYEDLGEIEQKIFFLTPVTVVKGCGELIRFPRQIKNHPDLYLALTDVVETNQKEMGVQREGAKAAVDFPFAFGISARRMMWEKIAFGLLMLIFAVLATLGIWIQLGQGMVPLFNLESFFIIGLFFIPFGIFFPILVVMAYRRTIHPELPIKFVLHQDRINVLYPHHRQECYRIGDLDSIKLNPIQSTLKSAYGGARVAQPLTYHELQLNFSGGKTIKLPPNRLSLFKQTPENLRKVFRQLYGI